VARSIRILVVDDHSVVRAGVVGFLGRQDGFKVVAEAESCATAVEAAREHKPDIAVVDVQLPDGSGVDLCNDIPAISPETGVVLFTSFAEPELLQRALAAGARGYVLKRMDLSTLAETVRAAADGSVLIDPDAQEALRAIQEGGNADGPMSRLSQQERRVLELISEGNTNRQIAATLDLAEKTVKNYVSSVLRKLGVARRSEAAAFMAAHDNPR
jgi:DNA-binding NarL/FixJ family response regulator